MRKNRRIKVVSLGGRVQCTCILETKVLDPEAVVEDKRRCFHNLKSHFIMQKKGRNKKKTRIMISLGMKVDPMKTFLVEVRMDGLLQNTTQAQECDPPASDRTLRYVLPHQNAVDRKYYQIL